MFKSLRWRIQIWHATILAVVISVFAVAMYAQQRHSRYRTIDSELAAAVEVLMGKLQAAPVSDLQALLADSGSTNGTNLANELVVPNTFAPRRYRHSFEAPYFVIWNSETTEVSRSRPELTVPKPAPEPDLTYRRQQFRSRRDYREAWSQGPSGSVLLVGRFIGPDRRDLTELMLVLAAIGVGVFALGLAGGWFLSRKSVRPIEQISRVASQISEHNLANRIDASEMDLEFGQLSQTLNGTFHRLETAFSQQAQFTADASHELRTPLSVIKMHQELALSKDRPAAEYRTALETCQRATHRMASLVDSLLTLAKMDASGLNLQLERVDISQVVKSAVDDTLPLATAKEIHVDIKSVSTPVFVNGDRDRLGQVITNLLANGVAYNPPCTAIEVAVSIQNESVVIAVVDNGIGIPAVDLPHIFDRFYRVQKERSRETGGSGLGLSICRTIVNAHRGSLTVESEVGGGSTFRVVLPCDTQSSLGVIAT